MQTSTTILTSQDGARTFKMNSIIGIRLTPNICLYVIVASGVEYYIGFFNSEKKAKEVMNEIWYAIDAGISYTVSPEV